MINPIQNSLQTVSFQSARKDSAAFNGTLNAVGAQEKRSVRGDYKAALNDVALVRDNAVAANSQLGKNLNTIA